MSKKALLATEQKGKVEYRVKNWSEYLDSSHKCNSRVHAALRSTCAKNTA